MNVTLIACVHHASERYGAPAVAAQYGLAHEFIDIDNPAYVNWFKPLAEPLPQISLLRRLTTGPVFVGSPVRVDSPD